MKISTIIIAILMLTFTSKVVAQFERQQPEFNKPFKTAHSVTGVPIESVELDSLINSVNVRIPHGWLFCECYQRRGIILA